MATVTNKRKVLSLSTERNLVMQEIGNGREKADVCQEFSLVNSMIPMMWKNRTTVISASEKNRSRIKQFQKPE
jgi:hypothetical protein